MNSLEESASPRANGNPSAEAGARPEPPCPARIGSFDLQDEVGTLTLEDGTSLRFDRSACRGFEPVAGAEVVVRSIGPHFRGGWRALEVELDPRSETYDDLLAQRDAALGIKAASDQVESLPDLRVEHTPGLCQPVTLYLGAAHGAVFANLIRSRVGQKLGARVQAAGVVVRLVPAMAGYEPWTADPLDPFAGDVHDEVTIGFPPERNEALAAACEGPQGTYTWPWFPELKIVRY